MNKIAETAIPLIMNQLQLNLIRNQQEKNSSDHISLNLTH